MLPPPISPLSDYTEKRVPGGTFEHESWELYTQSAGPGKEGEIDDELADIQESHHRQIKHYKTLLIRAQSASAASIHELHTTLTDLEGRYNKLKRDHAGCSAADSQGTTLERVRQERVDLTNVKGTMRNMGKDERLKVLSAVLEGCLPSDISTQIAILQKYRRSRFDILGALPEALAIEVMKYLDLRDILSLRGVKQLLGVWRYRCILLDGRTYPMTHIREDAQDDGVPGERKLAIVNYTYAKATGYRPLVSVTPAHNNYITSLCLHRDTLISGSYDESIRIWQLPPLRPSSQAQLTLTYTIPAKAVSCLAYHPPTKTLVAGYHDNGRIQIWRKTGQEWISHHVLHGHLHGIRAVAINAKWAVSAGADKTIIVWDWRTGDKHLKFGQQTNICIGLHLAGDMVISMTTDGIIRAFSITRREMVVQYKLWDLTKGPEGAVVIAAGMVSWFAAEGLDMACGTKDGICRFRWQSCLATGPSTNDPPSPSFATPSIKTSSTGMKTPKGNSGDHKSSIKSPMTASPLHNRTTHLAPLSTPTRSRTLTIPLLSSASSRTSSLLKPTKLVPRRSTTSSTGSSTPTRSLVRAPGREGSVSALGGLKTKSLSSSQVGPRVEEEDSEPASDLWVPDVTSAPTFAGMIAVKDVEKGVLGPNGRLVGSTRFAARQGAQREIYIGSYNAAESLNVAKMGGVWAQEDQRQCIRTPEKNPLSIVMDRDKVVYGCADGSLVVVGFV